TSGQTRPGFAFSASSASTLASFASNWVPAYLLNSVSERCDAAFQSPSAAADRQPTRRSSLWTDFARSPGGGELGGGDSAATFLLSASVTCLSAACLSAACFAAA